MSSGFLINRLIQTPPPASEDVEGEVVHAEVMHERRHYTLAEKMSIVRESQQLGVSQASISRKHNLGKNVLWTWRKSLAGFSLDVPQQGSGSREHEVLNLQQKIAELERLLGQKAFEIELLRSRLQSGMRSSGSSGSTGNVVNLDTSTKGAP